MSSVSQREESEAALALLTLQYQLLGPQEATALIREARQASKDCLELLLSRTRIDRLKLLEAVADKLGMPFYDLMAPRRPISIHGDILARADSSWLLNLNALPAVDGAGGTVVVVANPNTPNLRAYLDSIYDTYRIALGDKEQIRQILAQEASTLASTKFAGTIAGIAGTSSAPVISAAAQAPVASTPVLDWITMMLETAAAIGASDMHFEVIHNGSLSCRLRVDGGRAPQPTPLGGREIEIISAIMNRAGMNPANMREPQDGSFAFNAAGRNLDVRAAMIPLVSGPKVVLRLLDPANLKRLEALGFGDKSLKVMRQLSESPQGLMVVAGPTGSGKTTTLYAMLQEVVTPRKHIITIENPVEYRLPGVAQIAITPDRGDRSITFARALRTVLRLDPDIILVGEVRDLETARAAADSAMTGHLVLSTVHAPSAAGIYTRFIEIGIEPYMVAESITLGVSQRLVRRLHSCRRLVAPSPEQADLMHRFHIPVPETIGEPVGCPACQQRGFRGRLALAEVLSSSNALRDGVTGRASSSELIEIAGDNHISAAVDGGRFIAEGETTLAEVIRALTMDG